MINSFLVIFCSFWLIFCNFLRNERGERSEWSKNVAKYSAKKNKLLIKNKFTHPTETPLCLWYAVFVPNNLRFLNEKLILWNGKLNNGKINYFSLLNRNFLYRNVFSWLTLLSLGNYPTIEILCESWFRCIRNHWNMASITGGIQFQSQSSVFF